nr:hypothetical protein [Mixta intestinalis]
MAVTAEELAGDTAEAPLAFINTVANFVGLGLLPVLAKIKDMPDSYYYGYRKILRLVLENVNAWFTGKTLITPVP